LKNNFSFSSFFSQFGKIESSTFFPKTSQRHSAAAIITYGLSVDVNKIIKDNQRITFNGQNLFLRRTLPIIRPAYERFMSSNQLLVSLDSLSNDKQFNEINIRKYFSKYGSIVSCRIVILYTTYLIDFVEINSVDWVILDEPHFYNDKELILRKYVSPNRIGNFRTKNTKFSSLEKIRRLKHIIEAIEFGQKVELKLIKSFYEEKIIKYNEGIKKLTIQLRKICDQMNEDSERMKEKNNSLKLIIEQNQRIGKYITDLYKTKIENEQNRVNELTQAITSLSFY
jgi:hypothetical protein